MIILQFPSLSKTYKGLTKNITYHKCEMNIKCYSQEIYFMLLLLLSLVKCYIMFNLHWCTTKNELQHTRDKCLGPTQPPIEWEEGTLLTRG